MRKRIVLIMAIACILLITGCGKKVTFDEYDITGIEYIAWSGIDTVCENQELIAEGESFLFSMSENLLLSFVVDHEIELSDVLGEYDHLIMANPQWIERFGDLDKLKPVEYSSLTEEMRGFLEAQMPILTVDGSVLPDGVELYEYEGEELFVLVQVLPGLTRSIEAKNPLIILADKPEEAFKASSCMLPLTSGGHVLFTDGEKLQSVFSESELSNYGTIKILAESVNEE